MLEDMDKAEIAVIVNSYNRLPLLKESMTSLENVIKDVPDKITVVIFDANSTDGSIEWMDQFIRSNKHVTISLIRPQPGEDTSFSYGVNKACEFAIHNLPGLRYLFLYETDNYIKSFQPVAAAKKFLEEFPDTCACGFTVRKHDGSYAGWGSRFPTLLSFLLGQQVSFALKLSSPFLKWMRLPYGSFSYCEVVYTSPLLLKKEAWVKVKGFDHATFPFSDCDIDLAYRLHKENLRMAIVQTDDVLHDNLQVKSAWSSTRTINYYKARLRYFKKHYGSVVNLLKPFLWLMHVGEYGLLLSLVMAGRKEKKTLETRAFLVKKVFNDYR